MFNDRTYPNLCALFERIGVESVASDMSFSVSLREPDIEWSGTNLATVFGQRRNLLRPDFWRMVADILRFNRASVRWLAAHPDDSGPSLGDYLDAHGYSKPFRDWYLLPMAAAIWSCPTSKMIEYPFATFVRFCRNHGLLQIENRPQWRTVLGGGREYVKKLVADIPRVRVGDPVRAVLRNRQGVDVVTNSEHMVFDEVVLACHSDQALALLGGGALPGEREVLGAIRYQANHAVLHTDAAQLPRNKSLWSAWNYLAEPAGGAVASDSRPVSLSYLLNKLQPVPVKTPVVLSLNPRREIDPSTIVGEFDYGHPVFDGPAIDAQRRLDAIQGYRGVWFCGAWAGYGFHEDGLKSGMRVAAALGCPAPWTADGTPPIVVADAWRPKFAEAA